MHGCCLKISAKIWLLSLAECSLSLCTLIPDSAELACHGVLQHNILHELLEWYTGVYIWNAADGIHSAQRAANHVFIAVHLQ